MRESVTKVVDGVLFGVRGVKLLFQDIGSAGKLFWRAVRGEQAALGRGGVGSVCGRAGRCRLCVAAAFRCRCHFVQQPLSLPPCPAPTRPPAEQSR